MKSILFILTALCLLLSSTASGQRRPSSRERRPALPRIADAAVVARVGSRAITAEELAMNLRWGPAFTRRKDHPQLRALNFMIYEKLLALEGLARRVDTTEDARLSLGGVVDDLATEELYRREVAPRVHVGGEEIARGMRLDRVRSTVRWIYDRSRGGADTVAAALAAGASFDSLYRSALGDSIPASDRSMSATRFRIGLANAAVARVLDTLSPGRVSAPVGGPDGWYLIRLDAEEKDVLTTSSDDAKAHEDVLRALVKARSDSLSDAYVDSLLKAAAPVIVRRTLDIVHARLGLRLLPYTMHGAIRARLRERWGIAGIASVSDSTVLVQLANGSPFRIGDFAGWYHQREDNLHLSLSTPEALYATCERLVWRMVRDRLLAREARARGLDRTPSVVKQEAWWKDKIVYNIVRADMADSIVFGDDQLQFYYESNPRHFRDTSGAVMPFEKAKDDVIREYRSFELTKMELRRVTALKERYKVRIDSSAAARVPAAVDPKAIDVYTAKTGGVFPRPAFPVIDDTWQEWE